MYFIIPRFLMPSKGPLTVVREVDDKYKLISPLLLCTSNEETPARELSGLHAKLLSFVTARTTSTNVQDISIYFRDLNSGNWTGVNETEKFAPASMLKVPTILALLKKARGNPDFLNTVVRYDGKIDETTAQNFKPKNKIRSGGTYTINELIRFTIVESDNNARALLHKYINPPEIKKVYNDLGIFIPGSQVSEDFMSAKTYSYFLRLLYNASYIGRVSSENALEMLTETSFDEGLRAGVPAYIPVAHKFGEREAVSADNKTVEREFHDCGIIYAPEKPYLLCVMTRGSSFKSLSTVVAEASTLVYKEFGNARQ